jgi:hypothetical protein
MWPYDEYAPLENILILPYLLILLFSRLLMSLLSKKLSEVQIEMNSHEEWRSKSTAKSATSCQVSCSRHPKSTLETYQRSFQLLEGTGILEVRDVSSDSQCNHSNIPFSSNQGMCTRICPCFSLWDMFYQSSKLSNHFSQHVKT